MDGENILNSMLYVREHKFSDAIKLWDEGEIYIVFKTETLSVKPNPSRNSFNPIKFFKKENEIKTKLTGLLIDPIAYIIKIEIDNVYKYHISPINKEYVDYVKKYKKTIMNEFKDIIIEKEKEKK